MPTRRFTETWLRSLEKKHPPERVDYSEPGRKGFMLRHWPGGERTFVVRYQRDGKTRILTLGNYPATTLEEAHEAHAEARKQLSRGLDPIEEREREAKARAAQQAKEKAAGAVTIRNVIAEWAWHYARRHRKRPREAVRLLKGHLTKPLIGRPAHEITKRDLVKIIDRVLTRGSNVMANRLRDLIVQVFAFAAARDLIPSSPAAGLLRKPGGDEESKERSLSRDEVGVFWKAMAAPEHAISAPVRLGLKLILATAQRPGEVAGARWDEFDLKNGVWTIPGPRTKNGREHYVPLTDLAIELLHELQVLARDRPHVLPSVHSKLKRDEPISERALSRALRNNHKGEKNPRLFGIEPFTPHDLRRTAATHMTSLGIQRLYVNKLLNHADNETTAIYDRHHYWDEKKHALNIWTAELRAIISGKSRKVVPIHDVARAS